MSAPTNSANATPSARRTLAGLRRRLAWAGVAVALLVAVTLVAVRLLAFAPPVHKGVAARLNAASLAGQSVTIKGLEGDLLGRLSIESVSLTADDGDWGRLDGVTARWSPLALLFGGELRLDVQAETITIARRPRLEGDHDRAPSQEPNARAPRLQVSVDVARLVLGEGVAGPAGEYVLGVRVESADGAGSARARLHPRVGDGDMLQADLAWDAAAPLLGALNLEGRAGGLFASALGAPSGAPVRLELSASGALGDWRLDARGRVGETEAFALEAEDGAAGATARARLVLGPLAIAQPLVDRMGETIELRADLSAEGRLTAQLSAPALALEAEAVLTSPDDGRRHGASRTSLSMGSLGALGPLQSLGARSLQITATTLDAARLSGLETEVSIATPLAFVGEITRPDGAFRLTGTLETQEAAFSQIQARGVRVSGIAAQDHGALALDLTGSAQAISGAPAPLREGPLEIGAQARRNAAGGDIEITGLSLTAAGLMATSAGRVSADGVPALSGTARLTEAANAPLTLDVAWWLNGAASGELTSNVSGVGVVKKAHPDLARLLGPEVAFSVDLARDGEGGLSAPRIAARGAHVSLTGAAHMDDERVTANLDVQGAPVALSMANLGVSALSVRLDGDVGRASGVAVSATANATRIETYGRLLEDLALTFDGRLDSGLGGDLQLTGALAGAPLRASAALGARKGGWSVRKLEASHAGYAVSGALSGGPKGLSDASAALELVSGPGARAAVSGALVLDAGALKARLNGRDLEAVAVRADALTLTASGVWPRLDVGLTIDGGLKGRGARSTPLRGVLEASLDAVAQTLDARLDANIADASISTSRPLRVSWADGLRATGALGALGGELAVDAVRAPGDVSARLTLRDIGLAELGALAGRPDARGALAGEVTLLGGASDQISGSAALVLKGLAQADAPQSATDVSLTATLADETLAGRLIGRSNDAAASLDLDATFALPMETSISGLRVRLAEDPTLSASLAGTAAIAPYWALLGDPDVRLEGGVTADLSVAGPLSRLRPVGVIGLREGLFEDGRAGLLIKAIEIDARLDQSGVEVERARGEGGRGGSVTGEGRYAYNGSGAVAVTLNRLDALTRRDMQAIASGDLALTRRDQRTTLSGKVRLREARIDLTAIDAGASDTTLDVVFSDEVAPASRPDADARGARLDVAVTASRRFFITGAGLDTEWSLNARVGGTTGQPELSGGASLVRGEADVLSRRFRFEDSALSFSGAPEATQVRLKASRSVDAGVTSIIVEGTARDPDISLTSDPALPEDEVLAQVLFGRSPSSLSPLQAAQLAGAAAALARGDLLNLSSPLRSLTGLDRVEITMGETGAASVATGKYVADDVYVQVETGASGSPGVSVEWTPRANLELDATLDPQLGPSLAVKWKRDFDQLIGASEPAEPTADELTREP